MKTMLPITLKNLNGFGNKIVDTLLEDKNNLPSSVDEIYNWINSPKIISLLGKKQRSSIDKDSINESIKYTKNLIRICKELNIGIITILDLNYPKLFRNIDNRPTIIYYKGDISCLNNKSIAIIGTTEPTEKSKKVAFRLSMILSKYYNFNIVSGLALGCDTEGHKGCLDAKGKTVAIMPCGLDSVYPKSNEELLNNIINSGGCAISEYPVGIKTRNGYFVDRDRLQSALSKAVLVIETKEVGGTMHTVRFAQNQGRLIACYKPAEFDESTSGNKKLIEEGAIPIRYMNDIDLFVNKINDLEIKSSRKVSIQQSLL